MKKNDHTFFQNKDCAYFPCHAVSSKDEFNCMFCYCPLYTLGKQCGGNFTYLENGVKDCSGCKLPHSPCGYDYINAKFPELAALARKNT